MRSESPQKQPAIDLPGLFRAQTAPAAVAARALALKQLAMIPHTRTRTKAYSATLGLITRTACFRIYGLHMPKAAATVEWESI